MAWKFTIGSDPGTPPNATGPDSDPRVLTVTDLNGNNNFTVDPTGKIFASNGLQIAGTFTLTSGTPAPLQVLRSHYSFATQGGVAGTIGLNGATVIPSGSTILGGYLSVTTQVTGPGASVAVQVEAANDTVASAAISGAPWSTTGHKAIIPIFTVATELITTAARDVSIVISAANLTAGVFDVVLVYVPGV